MKKYIEPDIHSIDMEDLLEDEDMTVSNNTVIEDPVVILAKPFNMEFSFDEEEDSTETNWFEN